jgi:hypothetical protein
LQDETSLLLHECMLNIRSISHFIDEYTEQKNKHDLWDRVCYRLDACALVITQCVNLILLIVWLAGSCYFSNDHYKEILVSEVEVGQNSTVSDEY